MQIWSFYFKKIDNCHKNPKHLSKSKINLNNACVYSLFTHCSFDASKSKLDYFLGKDCMKKFCKDLREHAIEIIDCEEKEMITLTDEKKSYQ